jgi:sulfide:quinone oxidoreductase
MAQVVVIGGGTAGLLVAYELSELLREEERVTLVSDAPDFRSSEPPPWLMRGGSRRAAVCFPLGPALARKGIRFNASGARRLDPQRRRLALGDGSVLDYDFLVVATGPKPAFDRIKGFGPGGYAQSICHAEHASACARAWEALVAEPGPVIVGAVQDAPCIAAAYEAALAIARELERLGIRKHAPMHFVTPEPYIGELGLGGIPGSRPLLQRALREAGIEWIPGRVVRVEPARLHLVAGDPHSLLELPFKYCLLMPAFRSLGALEGIAGLTNASGSMLVDEYLRNPTYRSIYAAGVAVASGCAGPGDPAAPKPAYAAEATAGAVARNIGEEISGRPPSHRALWSRLGLVDLGAGGPVLLSEPASDPGSARLAAQYWAHTPRCASCDVAP